ncbi:transcriptional regulator WhiB [Pseudonocardia sulfidoxydans NBRC 16205]|uniref:Transcriptional regulator WhiB n=1 Tax=Pseudonocardia sulfidoxydans NBRC 16205 TaxID=1223511 RepID=A0A511DLN6_9PSEU|nr:WhiB family transcriptional regulator [Pseudonocardia sulfidoxydans]GEL25730.1 transcriptional regulator WhiB [Pseudonocardia sulfidoxydans NBRC 16205]
MSWHEQAACRGEDPALFFPVGNAGPAKEQTARAKAVCAGCPVIAQCREWARRYEDTGVWGGEDEYERRAARRRNARNRRSAA